MRSGKVIHIEVHLKYIYLRIKSQKYCKNDRFS